MGSAPLRGERALLPSRPCSTRALQQALLGERYSVHFASDGEAALEAARRLQPRLLIADILVPRFVFANARPDAPALRLTTRSEPALHRRVQQIQALVRRLSRMVQDLVGEIAVESGPEEATTLRFTLSRERPSVWACFAESEGTELSLSGRVCS